MEAIVTILIVIGVIAVAALLFGGWLIVSILKMLGRLINGAFELIFGPADGGGRRREALPAAAQRAVRCGHARCRALNPDAAHFCRRCGRTLGEPRPAAAEAMPSRGLAAR